MTTYLHHRNISEGVLEVSREVSPSQPKTKTSTYLACCSIVRGVFWSDFRTSSDNEVCFKNYYRLVRGTPRRKKREVTRRGN